MKKEKDHLTRKVSFEIHFPYTPEKGELAGIAKDLKKSIARHLINIPKNDIICLVECKCGFQTHVNCEQFIKSEWFCRNCGKVIVYEILG